MVEGAKLFTIKTTNYSTETSEMELVNQFSMLISAYSIGKEYSTGR